MSVDSRPILLVSMPWAPPTEPSLGLGILRSCLLRNGYETRLFHAHAHFLRWVSLNTNLFVADCWGLDEFVFTKVLDEELDDAQLQALVSRATAHADRGRDERFRSVPAFCDLFLTLREKIVPDFLNACARDILSNDPILVGFTCMFDQTIASAALAKILKSRSPDIPIAMGGYAIEGPPGDVVANAFPWIDYIVRGDGEETICDLARQASSSPAPTRSEVFAGTPITVQRYLDGGALPLPVTKPTRSIRSTPIDLNTSPTPTYTDWFADVETLRKEHKISIRTKTLPVESSRGCWWGQYQHCVFCGIDEETLKYRSKSPEAVLEMLHDLRHRYGENVCFRFADYIFPKKFYDSLLPELARVVPKFRLTGEIKANHTRERIELFANAGFFELQPGIESFSTPVLRAMDKGVRGIDNIALLKYGYENRIIVQYNFLYGFPTDQLEHYDRMVELIPQLYHLTPPVSRTEVIVTRFAPLQTSPQRFGVTALPRHHDCYDVLLSERFRETHGFNLDNYCYYFQRNFEYPEDLAAVYGVLVDQINHWKTQHQKRAVCLQYVVDDDQLVSVLDSRFGFEKEYRLDAIASKVYLFCNREPIRIARLQEKLAADYQVRSDAVLRSLGELAELRLVWQEDDLVFGLATTRDAAQERLASQWQKEWVSLYC